jgi:hypothetical protein
LTVAPAQESSEFDDWKAFRSDGGLMLVCPDCITPEEQQVMDEHPPPGRTGSGCRPAATPNAAPGTGTADT